MQSGLGRLPPLRPVPEPRVTTAVRVWPARLQHADHLLLGCGENDAARHLLQGGGAVEGIRDQVFLFSQDVIRAQEAAQVGEHVWSE